MEDSRVIIPKLYKMVSESLDKNDAKFRANIANFINRNHEDLFDIAPYNIIYFNKSDVDNMFDSLNIKESDVLNILKETCFWDDSGYNPQCAKEPYIEVLMMAIRYYLKNNKEKFAELTAIYLAFSGKLYASIYSGKVFKLCPPSKYPAVMDYVINNMLTDKFDLKREGSVYGAIKAMCCTWLQTYKKDFLDEKLTDDRIGKLLEQLRGRETSFLMNIAKLYFEAYKNKNYLNYETDNLDQDNFRLTDNDAAIAARITENTMNYLTSNYVSLEICNKCKDQNVKSLEIKDILECILSDNNNLNDVRRVVNILICDFMKNNPNKKVGSIEFVSYSIKPKPNTKDEIQIELKETVLKWLEDNSPTYRKRKSRESTRNSYYKSILFYFVLVINKIAR